MKTLHIFYDGGCGICGKLRDRFEPEPATVQVHFVAYQSLQAKELVPNLADYHPETGMIALTDDGKILQGVHTWIRLLGVMPRFRWVSQVLGFPPFRPISQWVYERVAKNRRILSRLLGLPNLTPEEEKCDRCAW